MSGQFHAPAALPPGKQSQVPIRQEAGWTPKQPVRSLGKRRNSFPCRELTTGVQHVARRYTDWAIVYYSQTKRRQLLIQGHTELHLQTVTIEVVRNSCQYFQIAQYTWTGPGNCFLIFSLEDSEQTILKDIWPETFLLLHVEARSKQPQHRFY
jgi:hypothetical protein